MQQIRKNPIKPNKSYLFLCVIGILVIELCRYSSQRVLNYPVYLFYCCWIITALTTIIVDRNRFKEAFNIKEWRKDSLGYLLLNMLIWTVISGFAAAILLIPFNYLDIYVSNTNPEEIFYCQILSVDAHRGAGRSLSREAVYFRFQNTTKYRDYYDPIVWDISNLKNYDKYQFEVIARKGFLDTYILDEGRISLK